MNPEDIFHAVLAEPPAERSVFLAAACADDEALRHRIEALVQAHEHPGSFLADRPPMSGVTVDEPNGERLGDMIGSYKLLEQIGEGGFGVVFLAEQMQPVRRKVALKVLKLGMDTRQVVARFEAERQALAIMDHANIAKVHDGGVTLSGRPFFVMELVKGVPITAFCDQNQLTPRQRLDLFVPVCQAVQHAHHKGIIHRDLKPSNVLVTVHDTTPVVKVIDFGVAKALGQELTDKTLFTGFAQMIGTPLYMSPEQAGQSGLDIDTRSDIYSLGVLLYELLTGTTPFDRDRFKKAAYDEIRHIIRDEEPPRPSTRLSDLTSEPSPSSLASISALRQTEPATLTKLVRGELDWIVMKCLEKDRNRRYETANGVAADLQRYLNDEPVTACPPSAGYRLRKFAHKNRKLLATFAAFVMLLATTSVISTWFGLQTRQAYQQEKRERERAEALAETERHFAYGPRIQLAKQAWEEQDLDRMREVLEGLRPARSQKDIRGFEWHYLWRLAQSDQQPLPGHAASVECVSFSPDGAKLATASNDGMARIWDAQRGPLVASIRGHSRAVVWVAFSGDGRWLATCSKDHTAKLWDAVTGQERLTLARHTAPVWSLAFSPDSQRLVTAGADHLLRVWEVPSGKHVLDLKGHTNRVSRVAYSPTEHKIASGGFDHTVRIWDSRTGSELFALKGHRDQIRGVAFSPNGKQLATCAYDQMIKIWDVGSGRELVTCLGHTSRIRGLAFSPDGLRIASAGDRVVKIWNAETGKAITDLKTTTFVNGVVYSADGQRLAVALNDLTARVWDAPTGKEIVILEKQSRALRGHTEAVHALAYSPDGRRIATGGVDRLVKVWELATNRAIASCEGHTARVCDVAFSPDGKWIASGSADNTVRHWDATSGQEIWKGQRHSQMVTSVAYSPDGKWVVSSGFDRSLRVWDAVTGLESRALPEQVGRVYGIAFSPDGQHLATCNGEYGVEVWDFGAGSRTAVLIGGHADHVLDVVYSPDGQHFATSGHEGTIKLWNARTSREILTLKGHTLPVFGVAFTPDGRRLASSSKDHTVRMWDTITGQELLVLNGPGWFHKLAFSPDGTQLAAGNSDRTVHIWEVKPAE